MTEQHDIADECEHRLDEHYSVHSSVNCKSVNVAELHADLARYAAHMRQQAERIKKLEDDIGWFSSAVDSINVWARESGIAELNYDWRPETFVQYLRNFHGDRNSVEHRRMQKLYDRIAALEKLVREATAFVASWQPGNNAEYPPILQVNPDNWLSAAREAVGEGAK